MKQQTERELFEEAAYKMYFLSKVTNIPGQYFASVSARPKSEWMALNAEGDYVEETLNSAWWAWQAARSPLLSTISQHGEALEAARKDSERYRWLSTHYKYANDSMAEIWFDRDITASDSKESLDKSIDAALISQKVEG